MNILFRYISTNFLKLFFICILSFLTIYLTIDFMSKFWKLSARDVPFIEIGRYFIFKVPLILTQVTPMATLLATLLTLGILSRNSEITVIKSSGISIYYLSIPIVALSLVISLFSLATSEYLVPYSNKRFKAIERYRPGQDKTQRLFRKDKIWYFGVENIYKIDLLDLNNKVLHDVTVLKLDNDYEIAERTDAKKVIWKDNGWVFADGLIRYFRDPMKVERFQKRKIEIREKFSDFTVISQTPEEMSFKELKKYIDKLKNMGLDHRRYFVDLLAKISFPLVNLSLPLIGIPFALKTGRSAGIASGVGLSIVIGFAYWVTMAFNISLGHVGALPPFIAAFGSNIIFGLLGLILIMSVKT